MRLMLTMMIHLTNYCCGCDFDGVAVDDGYVAVVDDDVARCRYGRVIDFECVDLNNHNLEYLTAWL